MLLNSNGFGSEFNATNGMESREIHLDYVACPSQTAHILPCTIQCNDEADTTAHFRPEALDNAQTETYLRGRKLLGQVAELPADHQGYVFDTSRASHSTTKDEELVEVKQWKQIACFDKINVHGNTQAVDAQQDVYLKAVQEWTQLANIIHS